jgi:hypothetical protein
MLPGFRQFTTLIPKKKREPERLRGGWSVVGEEGLNSTSTLHLHVDQDHHRAMSGGNVKSNRVASGVANE